MEARNHEMLDPDVSAHNPARPMKVVTDRNGTMWLCDREVDEKKALKEQGCWQCGDLAFTRDD
jgi:hypothetical protein